MSCFSRCHALFIWSARSRSSAISRGDRREPLGRGLVLLLAERLLLDLERGQPPLESGRSASGSDSISILRRLAASSTRSMALSGRWRSVM